MWQEKDRQLYKKFEFKDFKQAFQFITDVANLAEAQDHHPKWTNEYNKVEIWLKTHAKNKVTDKDHRLARAIDQLLGSPQVAKMDSGKLYSDGGSRGNPGPSAGAFVICKMDDTVVEKTGFYIGVTTNNQAEYQALYKGLQRTRILGLRRLNVFMDSELIVKQLNGLYKIKNKDLEPLYRQIKDLVSHFQEISFNHVPRALNKEADQEVNRVLDEKARAL